VSAAIIGYAVGLAVAIVVFLQWRKRAAVPYHDSQTTSSGGNLK